jgi:hypothetical protein
VHKISAYKYIYMKMGKRNGKRKRRRNFQLARPGGISAHPGARARARGPTGLAAWEQQQGTARGAGSHAREREGADGVDGNGGRGFRPKSGRRRIPRQFSAVGPVLRRGSRGEARAGAGDHGGGVNWTGGGLWWPVHGAVASVRGGVVTGAAYGCNRGGEVCLVTVIVWWSSSASLIVQRITRKGERSSPKRRGRHGGASSIGSGGSSGDGRSWCGEYGARAGPFIGTRGRERDGGDGEHRRARHDGGNGANAD